MLSVAATLRPGLARQGPLLHPCRAILQGAQSPRAERVTRAAFRTAHLYPLRGRANSQLALRCPVSVQPVNQPSATPPVPWSERWLSRGLPSRTLLCPGPFLDALIQLQLHLQLAEAGFNFAPGRRFIFRPRFNCVSTRFRLLGRRQVPPVTASRIRRCARSPTHRFSPSTALRTASAVSAGSGSYRPQSSQYPCSGGYSLSRVG